MSELPVPFGLKNESKPPDGGLSVKAVEFQEKTHGPYTIEYGKIGNKLVFHFFKDGPFSMGFRSRLYRAFVGLVPNGKSPETLLEIDWVPEFSSWCVIYPDVLSLNPPPSEELIEGVLQNVFS